MKARFPNAYRCTAHASHVRLDYSALQNNKNNGYELN